MTMKSINQIMGDYQANCLPALPAEKYHFEPSQTDIQLINGVFKQLQVIFPAWQRAFPNTESLDMARKEWIKALVESGTTTKQLLQFGLESARKKDIPFFPSPGQFIGWCKPTPEAFGLPTLEIALMEVARHRATHPAVVLAAKATKWERQTLTADEYKPVFERAYEQLVRRVMAGEDLNAEVMKALPTKEQIQHNPEFYQEAGKRGLAQLRAVMRGRA